jgi:hypothetical protein
MISLFTRTTPTFRRFAEIDLIDISGSDLAVRHLEEEIGKESDG